MHILKRYLYSLCIDDFFQMHVLVNHVKLMVTVHPSMGCVAAWMDSSLTLRGSASVSDNVI